MDNQTNAMADWTFIEQSLLGYCTDHCLRATLNCADFYHKFNYAYIALIYDIISTFIESHEITIEILHENANEDDDIALKTILEEADS